MYNKPETLECIISQYPYSDFDFVSFADSEFHARFFCAPRNFLSHSQTNDGVEIPILQFCFKICHFFRFLSNNLFMQTGCNTARHMHLFS